MAYFPPVITAAGLSLPVLTDIQTALLESFQAIYGSTTYLGNDASDYQWITAVSLKLSDNMALCQLAYNSRSPLTAIGSGLDSISKLNGLTRLVSSFSTVSLRLSGLGGSVINNGVVSDTNGNLWTLPSGVTIGVGGTVNATAVCQTGGAISAAAGTITTPVGGFTAGWISVTNPSPASVGTPAESDSNFRARQSVSVALPSETRLAGTVAEVKQVAGVTLTNILENQTGATDAFGNLGHSLTVVAFGGTDLDVATAIYNNRGIGCNTQGATVPTMTLVPVTDPNSGNITVIGFVRPVFIPVYVSISVHGLNAGFTTQTQTQIVAAIVTYLNSLQIGEEVTQSALYGAALAVMPNLLQPLFSIRAVTLGTSPSPVGTTDLVLQFFEVSSGLTAHTILTVV